MDDGCVSVDGWTQCQWTPTCVLCALCVFACLRTCVVWCEHRRKQISLTLHGIEAAEHLKSAVFALKNGRELPALTYGVSSGSVQSAGARSHQIAMRAGKSNASGSNSAPTAAPVSVQMSRMEPKLAAGGFEALQRELQREHSELMQAMNEQTALLSRIADARA